MTDGRRPIRQISGNLQEFQAAISELKHVTPKAVIYEGFVEGRLEAPKPLESYFAEYRRCPIDFPEGVYRYLSGETSYKRT
jgi:hypothetical protein